ncbi:hypothetical protein [Polynucleobacter necessarius]|uniref:hypothetical protein n=1 Tax=Polynucleobacter necessarius TaxID=576610 RepID=UPI001E58F82D|nr:hypothetical protein [Polynucleobacter necessarius]
MRIICQGWGATSRLGLVTNDGMVIDIPAEAARQKVQLSFDPTSMISLAGSGNKGLSELAALFKNPQCKPNEC